MIDPDKLRALDEAATPGPWETDSEYDGDAIATSYEGCSNGYHNYFVGADIGGKWRTLLDTVNSDHKLIEDDRDEDGGRTWDVIGKANAELVAYLRNAVPAILAMAGQAAAPAAEPEERPNAQNYRNRAERAEAECADLRAKVAELEADKARLDYLDRCNAALNARYGTTYRWKLIQSHNVNRLMIGDFAVDLHDSQPHGLPSCRDAIDERIREAMERAA